METTQKHAEALLELAKPRITLLAAFGAATGFAAGSAGRVDPVRLAWTLLGVTLAAAATGALNQWLEAEADGRMRRTRGRPIPSGRLSPGQALAFGSACAAASLVLAWKVNLLSWTLAALTLAGYLLVYTPLKTRTPLAVWIGAVPGAMPPLIGWAAAAGRLDPGAGALFAIQLAWQVPHVLALGWLLREDYARAGILAPAVADPSGRSTRLGLALSAVAMVPCGLLPLAAGLGGAGAAAIAVALGAGLGAAALAAARDLEERRVRLVFRASLAYLPGVFGALALAG